VWLRVWEERSSSVLFEMEEHSLMEFVVVDAQSPTSLVEGGVITVLCNRCSEC
jgi:hypothetical protein